MPWRILASPGGYIRSFVLAYSTFTGSILGVMLADFFVVRRRSLPVDEMYLPTGDFRFYGGFNLVGVTSCIVAIGPCFPGLVARLGSTGGDEGSVRLLTEWLDGDRETAKVLQWVYDVSWFVSVGLAAVCYLSLHYCSRGCGRRPNQLQQRPLAEQARSVNKQY